MNAAVRLLALAAHTLRTAARTRVTLCLLLATALIVLGLPAILANDGTPSGLLRTHAHDALGLATGLLGLVMLGYACAGMAGDTARAHLRQCRVHPVSALESWLGLWLGLFALTGIVLAVAGGLAATALTIQLRRPATAADSRPPPSLQPLATHLTLAPRPLDLTAECEARLAQATALGWNPDTLPRAEALRLIHRQLRAESATVAPGTSRTWHFDLPPRLPPAAPASLRLRLAPATGADAQTAGTWSLRPAAGAAPIPLPPPVFAGSEATVPLDAVPLRPGSVVELTFTSPAEPGIATAAFDLDYGVQLRFAAGSLAPNLIRALLVIWCRIGLLCALGLLLGTCFSLPVATFAAMSLVLLACTSRYVTTGDLTDLGLSGTAVAVPRLQLAGTQVLRGLEWLAAPAMQDAPLEALADGVRIGWRRVAAQAGLLLAGYGAVIACASAAILRRRELAAET